MASLNNKIFSEEEVAALTVDEHLGFPQAIIGNYTVTNNVTHLWVLICGKDGPTLKGIRTWTLPQQQVVEPIPVFGGYRRTIKKQIKLNKNNNNWEMRLARAQRLRERAIRRTIWRKTQNVPKPQWAKLNSEALKLRNQLIRMSERTFIKFNYAQDMEQIFKNLTNCCIEDAVRHTRHVLACRTKRASQKLMLVQPSLKRFGALPRFAVLEVEDLGEQVSYTKAELSLSSGPSKRQSRRWDRMEPEPKPFFRYTTWTPPITRERRNYLLQLLRTKYPIERYPYRKRMEVTYPSALKPEYVVPTACEREFLQGLLVQPQMDGPHGEQLPTIEDKASNVCLVENRQESKAETCEDRLRFYQNLASGDLITQYPELTDRWIQVDTFQWKDEADTTLLKEYHFPAYLMKSRGNSPNTNPLRCHQYWAGDVEIKIMVNSNKFMVGQLQCAWLYDTIADKEIKKRKNIHTLSATDHTIINAGTSSSAKLYVHYKNPRPFLPITNRMDSINCLNLGTLYIHVISQLSTPSTVRTSADVSIFVRLPKSRFAGIKNQDIGQFVYPQMDVIAAGLAVGAAENLLNRVTADTSRDNPPVTGMRNPMVPQACQSYCYGDKAPEPVNALRLDPRGQTPHIPTDCDEMSVEFISRRWGMLKSQTWKVEYKSGTLLKTFDATPMPKRSDMKKWTYQSNDCYAIPPCGVISSMFEHWRGSLELRIDFVASQFHTGRILVAYSPRNLQDITFEQALGCYNAFFDLQEDHSFTFIVPYITNYVVWPRTYGYTNPSDLYLPPGRIHIFVMNELNMVEQVRSEVAMIFYWRAHTDFSVYVPAQPSIGTSFWTTDDKPTNEVKAQPGYWPWYIGYDSYVSDGKKAILRYGPLDTHLAQFFNTKYKTYYTINEKFAKYTVTYKNAAGAAVNAKYFVPVSLNDGYGAVYMGVCESQAKAIEYIKSPNHALLADVYHDDESPYTPDDINIVFDGTEVQLNPDGSVTLKSQTDDGDFYSVEYTDVHPQIGENTLTMDPCMTAPVARKECGMGIFGEECVDMKSYCRRFQPYGLASFKLDAKPGNVTFQFPAIPQGLDLQIVANEAKNSYFQKCMRDGAIPVLLSGFRFARGGLRFKLVTNAMINQNIWIQHKPQYLTGPSVSYPKDFKIAANLMATGSAAYIQSSAVNNICEFEVPYYKPGMFIYLQRPNLKLVDASNFAHLGTVAVGVESFGIKAADVIDQQCAIFYSVADDFMASTFQGFPPMLFLDSIYNKNSTVPYEEIQNLKIEPQINLSITHNHQLDTQPLEQVINLLMDATGNLAVDFVSQLGHILLNPTYRTIVWATLTMMVKMNLLNTTTVTKLLSLFTQLGDKLGRSFLKLFEQPLTHNQLLDRNDYSRMPGDPVLHYEFQAELQDADTLLLQIINMIWSALCLLVGVTCNMPKSFSSFFKSIFVVAPLVMRNAHFSLKFMTDHFELVKKMIAYLTYYKNQDKLFSNLEQEDYPVFSHWIDECEILLNPSNENFIYSQDAKWAERLEHAYTVGIHIMKIMALSKKQEPSYNRVLTCVRDVMNRMRLKREAMHKRGISAISRREPFCLYLSGEPGIGKSQLISTVVMEMLKKENIQFSGEMIFCLQSGSQYWDGVRNQPAIVIDDFLSVNKSPLQEESLRALFQIKSPAILNPPMAALEDKELRYAPEIAVITANNPFHKVCGADETAIYRRRDALVSVMLQPQLLNMGFTKISGSEDEFKRACSDLNYNMQNFDHLLFQYHNDPSDPDEQWGQIKTYNEFKQDLLLRFSKYRTTQMQLYDLKKQQYDSLFINDAELGTLRDKSEEYKRLVGLALRTLPVEGVSYKTYFNILKRIATTNQLHELEASRVIRPVDGTTLEEVIGLLQPLDPQMPSPNTLDGHNGIIPMQSHTPLIAVLLEEQHHLRFDNQTEFDQYCITKAITNTHFGAFMFKDGKLKSQFLNQRDGNNDSILVAIQDLYRFCSLNEIAQYLRSFQIGKISQIWEGHVLIEMDMHKFQECCLISAPVNLAGFFSNFGERLFMYDHLMNVRCQYLSISIQTLLYQYDDSLGYGVWTWMPNQLWDLEGQIVKDGMCAHCQHASECFGAHDQFMEVLITVYEESNPIAFTGIPQTQLPRVRRSTSFSSILQLLKFRDEFKVKWLNWKETGISFLKNYALPAFVAFFSVAASVIRVLAFIKIAKFVFSGEPAQQVTVNHVVAGPSNVAQPQVYSATDNMRAHSATHISRPTLRNYVAQPQSALVNFDKVEHAETLIIKNTYFIKGYSVPLGSTIDPELHALPMVGRFTFINGQHGILVKHLYEYFQHNKTTHISFNSQYNTIGRIIPFSAFQVFLDHDSAILVCKVHSVPHHRNLLKHFAKLNQHNLPRGKCLIIEPTELGVNRVEVNTSENNGISIMAVPDSGIASQKLGFGYSYPWSKRGYCGAFLLNPNCPQNIIGYHCSGAEGVGFAEPLIRETFNQFTSSPSPILQDELIMETSAELPVEGAYIPIGEVHQTLYKHQSGETRLRPTLIQGVFPVITEPGPLKQGDKRVETDDENYSPLYRGVENMLKPPFNFPPNVMEQAKEDLKRLVLTKVEPVVSPARVRSVAEIVVGVPGIPFFDGLDMTTSEGFPLSRYRPGGVSNKEWLFKFKQNEDNRELIAIEPRLMNILTEKRHQRLQNYIPVTIFDDCLKDARLTLDKIKIPGKTRIFSASPVDFVIEFKRYFIDFLIAYKTARYNVEHAIGISPDSVEWAHLARYLARGLQNPKFITGDYSNFGPTLAPNAVEAANEIMVAWIVKNVAIDVPEQYLKILLLESSNALHLVYKYVYQVYAGSPSGAPDTVEKNSLVNCLYIRCAWLEIMGERAYRPGFEDYYRFVRNCTYGDDLIMAVADDIKEYFNNETLMTYFSKYNIKFTDADKKGNLKYVNDISETKFLKRGFRPHPRYVNELLAPLDLDVSVKDTANWCHDKLPLIEATRAAAEATLANAYGHGPKIFNMIKDKLCKAMQDKQIFWTPRSWDDWDKIHFPGYYESTGGLYITKTKLIQERDQQQISALKLSQVTSESDLTQNVTSFCANSEAIANET